MAYRFGDFTLDPDTRRLLLNAADVHVSPKAFELLRLLVENRARAVAKPELQELLWPTTFVEETNLASLVAEIRRALGDIAASPRFVRTVYAFGYQFVGDVTPSVALPGAEPPVPTLWLVVDRREIPLLAGVNVIGRGADAAIRIDSPGVSRCHARILVTGGEAVLEDLGSKNGTDLNGQRLVAGCALCDGDRLRLGTMVAVFRLKSPSSPTDTVPVDPSDR